MPHRPAWFVAAFLLVTGGARVQADEIDDFVRRQLQSQRIPGATVVVLRDGKVTKAEAYGMADVKNQTPATVNTVYHVGSVSKTIVASGIMLLVEEGKVRLDDPVRRFLPDAPEAWNGITVRHLLSHTSGLVRDTPGWDRVTTPWDPTLIRVAYPVALRFAPGEKWEYSNLGYAILGQIISMVSGQPWADFLSARILRPAGMLATRPTTHEPVPGRAVGYTDNDRVLDARFEGNPHPAGPFLSTALDLAKWDAALRAGTILKPETLRQMWTAVTLNDGKTYPYGLGWELSGGGRGPWHVHHGGAINGYLSELVHLVEEKVSVIVLINIDDADMGTLVRGVVNRALAMPN